MYTWQVDSAVQSKQTTQLQATCLPLVVLAETLYAFCMNKIQSTMFFKISDQW